MTQRRVDIGERLPVTADPGPAPDVTWVAVDDLVVDEGYQRPLLRKNWTQIVKIANAFHWQRFTACMVAPLADGRYALIDGQHRVHAAKLCGIAQVPCVSIPMSRAEQAAAFSEINGTVTQISQFHILRAALTAGEPWAMQASEAVAKAGCRLMTANKSASEKKPGEVFCIRWITKLCSRGETNLVTSCLAALRESQWGAGDPEAYSYSVLQPLMTAVGRNIQFLKLDLGAFVDAHDIFDITERARSNARGVPGVTAFSLAADEITQLLREQRTARAVKWFQRPQGAQGEDER